MPTLKGVDFPRLRTAVDWSVQQFATPRKNHLDAVQQYVGAHYADGGTDKRVPTNMLELAVTIYVRQLAARAPRAEVTTNYRELRPFARSMELALNQVPDEIGLGRTLRKAVIGAIFGVGVCKVGICSTGETVEHDIGRSFVDIVSIDDYFCDMSAKDRDSIQFEGNDYWMNLTDARSIDENKEGDRDLEADEHTISGDNGEEREEGISQSEGADLYKDKVWMRDVYLPDTNQMVTYGVKSKRILRVIDWDGPQGGPYHMLGFSDVPGNLLPLPPVALWLDLHELCNSMFRKLAKQGDSKKTVAGFQGGDDAGPNALKNASDGEGITYNGQPPENITVGGIDAPTLAFYLQTKDLFSYHAGNLDALGGLSPMTDTVGQDKLLTAAAGARVDHMREETINFARGIFKALAWYEWTDPIRKRVVGKKVKGTDIVVMSEWSEKTREGDFLDYNLDIDVYSMQSDTPSIHLQKLLTTLERVVFPVLPQIQAQGGSLDFPKLLETIGRLGDIPELADIVVFDGSAPPPPTTQGGSPQPALAANTTRTYERVNRPGATRSGKEAVMSQILMGAGAQPDEVAAIGRPVG